MPFIEVVGSGDRKSPEHTEGIGLKPGIIEELTSIVMDFVMPHCPESGVKIYVVVSLLLIVLGNQLPLIPLFDVVGKFNEVEFEQIEIGMPIKTGVIDSLTLTIIGERELSQAPILWLT
jgi:hypothetical protein